MNVICFIFILSMAWFISELLLGIFKRSEDDYAQKVDRYSFRLLWVTIMIAVISGVSVGLSGVGLIGHVGYRLSILGMSLMVIGLVIRWTAVLTLRRYFTVDVAIVEGHKIVQSGLYKYIRHPAYTGSLLTFLGLGLSFSNWLAPIIIVVPVLLAFLYRIRVEEAVLIRAFGDDYKAYMRRTWRLIPFLY